MTPHPTTPPQGDALDTCMCGDYRRDHVGGIGPCRLNGIGHNIPGYACTTFRLAPSVRASRIEAMSAIENASAQHAKTCPHRQDDNLGCDCGVIPTVIHEPTRAALEECAEVITSLCALISHMPIKHPQQGAMKAELLERAYRIAAAARTSAGSKPKET